MAIGTATAIMGAAAIGGSILGAKSQKKAASKAAQAQTQASSQQLQLGRETNALNERIYGQGLARLDPSIQRGDVAGQSYNALLGLPQQQPQAPVMQQPQVAPQGGIPYGNGVDRGIMSQMYRRESDPQAMLDGSQAGYAAPQQFAQQPQITQPSAMEAFNNFANSAGMKFQIQEGANALNNHYAGSGALNSGAAMKELQSYGQNTALNNYFMPYMNMLDGQQRIGAGAASSAAGVGQNFVNTAAGIAGQQGNAIQSGANALSDRAAVNGIAKANMWSGIGGALGTMATSFGAPSGGGMGGFGGGYTPFSIRGLGSMPSYLGRS